MININEIQIIVPCAGDGKRFQYTEFFPYKPFVEINAKKIIEHTLDSISDLVKRSFVNFVIRKDHNEMYNVEDILKGMYNCNVICLDMPTRGGMETCYIACQKIGIDPEKPLLLLDSDNYYQGDKFEAFLSSITKKDFGCLCCFDIKNKSELAKWAYILLDERQHVKEIKEKDQDIVNRGGMGLVGVFFYSRAKLFLDAAQQIMDKNDLVKNEFYLSQSIVYLLKKSIPVYAYKSPRIVALGTPEDVRDFLTKDIT